ncbi:hypothetical protein NLO85_23955 [Pseudomonas savastanoi]|uniref:Uncharacterized protein n=1 Tax=Pseudomonas savastanoi TaxID=29438 RepID=A0AAW5JCF4_PSESS|nr:hypothetical protein [Pseudomonas savastanoi]MCQ3023540.1 hypothetical protein [Pseudomonas savastanoi]
MEATSPSAAGTMIGEVVLDAFGTIVRINRRLNPYRELIREGRRQGCDLTLGGTHFLMTANLLFVEMASQLGISLWGLDVDGASMKDVGQVEIEAVTHLVCDVCQGSNRIESVELQYAEVSTRSALTADEFDEMMRKYEDAGDWMRDQLKVWE